MRNRAIVFFLLLTFLICIFSIPASADNHRLTVYVASGSKSAYRYHARANCPSLRKSVVANITLEEAALLGFTPCTRCHPPEPDFEIKATPRPASEGGGSGDGSTSGGTVKQEQRFTNSPTFPDGRSFSGSRSSSNSSSSDTGPKGIVRFLSVSLMSGAAILTIVKRKKRKAEEERLRKEREEKERQFMIEKRKYEEEYKGKTTLQLSGAPSDCYVGSDRLPACSRGNEKWGEGFTVYMTPQGRAYHRRTCIFVEKFNAHPVNAYEAKTGYRSYNGKHYFYSCSYCHPVLPDLSWYCEYKTIKANREEYDIPEPSKETLPF